MQTTNVSINGVQIRISYPDDEYLVISEDGRDIAILPLEEDWEEYPHPKGWEYAG